MIRFFYRDADELITFEAMISINPLKRLNMTQITSKKLCQCSEEKKAPGIYASIENTLLKTV